MSVPLLLEEAERLAFAANTSLSLARGYTNDKVFFSILDGETWER